MTEGTGAAASSPPSSWRQWFEGRRRLLLAGLVIVAAGLWLGWDWLAAVGALPLLLALLPCLAMCALGLCMRSGTGGSCEQQPGNPTGSQGKT
jgi:hypothetical protein